jgi:mono/diheme cytochrome c family protein
MSRHHAAARWLPACLAIAGAGALSGALAGAAGKTVWDGVYSAAQADRGKDIFAQQCSGCHGDFLDGDGANGRVVALSGDTFADNWESASLNDLFVKIGRTMPRSSPGTLSSADTLNLMAFVLQYNGFPAGTGDLRESPELSLVDIVGKEGPRPLRPGSGVRVVGCLAQEPGDVWTLTRASAPVRTRTPGASTGPDVDRARTTALGSQTIRLASAKPGPDVRAGAKVEVKGALAAGAESAITVMSLQVVAATCE